MKASPEAQLRLLELADIDAELAGSSTGGAGFLNTPSSPGSRRTDAELRDSIAALTAQNSDLRREQAKAEADVEQVRSRIDRDRQRLDSGMVNSPRELENLQSEVQSLHRRQSDLEEVVLDVMERLETAQTALAEASSEREQLADIDWPTVTAARDAALAELGEQSAKAIDRRVEVAAAIAGRPARPLRQAPRAARRGRRRRAPASPLPGLQPDAQHRGPERDQGGAGRRGPALRRMQADPGQDA